MTPPIPERNWVNIQWLARLRWAEVAGQAVTVLAGQFLLGGSLPIAYLLGVIGVGLVSNLYIELYFFGDRRRGKIEPRPVHEWQIALVMMAVSPVPPFLPKKAIRAGGSQSYIISLLAMSALVSIVTAPVSLHLLDDWFGLSMEIQRVEIARPLLATVLAPLVAGLIFARLAPNVSASWAHVVSGAGTILLAAAVLPQLVRVAPALTELVGDGTLVAIAAFALCALSIGHVLGGPVEGNRSVLALCTATRHPFIAIALIQANFANQRLAVPAVFMALIVTSIASVPYVRMRKAKSVRTPPQSAPLPQPQSPRST